jgi:hypothetical protein
LARVNLLGSSFGKVKQPTLATSKLKKIPFVFFALSVLFLGIAGYLRAFIFFQERGLSAVQERKASNEMLRKKVAALNEEQVKLKGEVDFLGGYADQGVLWSVKLQRLAALTPKELWFDRFSFERSSAPSGGDLSKIKLKGGLIPRENTSPIGTLSAFINQLKDDADFSSDFDDPVLSDVRSDKLNKTEILSFAVEMALKKKSALIEKEPK